MNIALFDFDGTISSKDSFMLYTLYISGSIKFVIGLLILSPILIMYKFRLVSNQFMKSSIIRFYYKNLSLDQAKKLSKSFSTNIRLRAFSIKDELINAAQIKLGEDDDG